MKRIGIPLGFVLWMVPLLSLASVPPAFPSKRKASNGVRVEFGPSLGFYTLNTRHAVNPSQGLSFLLGAKYETRADRSFRTFFSAGVDYFMHGVNFKSYYFGNDSIQLYTKTYAYYYSLYIHEVQVPLQLKLLFKRADNSPSSAYAIIGFHVRYLVTSNLRVSEDGTLVKKDAPSLSFKTPLFDQHVNSFVSVGFGWQRNSKSGSKGNFFAEASLRTGVTPYSFSRPYAASSLYISSTHALLLLGFKF